MMLPGLSLLAALSGAPTTAQTLVVYAERIHTAPGSVIENGSVSMSGAKITAIVGGTSAPRDAVRVAAITAGMIDLSGRITGAGAVEQTSEVTPHVSVAPGLDLYDVSWDRQLASGVTAVLVFPPDENVIGGLGLVLKTGGEPAVEARTLKADACLRGSFGTQPSERNHPAFGRPTDFYSRRPTTRMGVEWEWRKAMYDALAAERDPARAFPGSDVLLRALKGELPVFVQAWATQDIRTAVFLKEEMAEQGKPDLRLVIDAGAEAWREPQLLERSGAAVVLPPFPAGGRVTDGAFMAWNVAQDLVARDIPVALSSHNARSATQRLGVQAAFARRGGLSFDEALAAVTIAPARMIGVDERVGSLAPGKDADLVLWSGEPFEVSSRVVGVVLDGELLIDPRASE